MVHGGSERNYDFHNPGFDDISPNSQKTQFKTLIIV